MLAGWLLAGWLVALVGLGSLDGLVGWIVGWLAECLVALDMVGG